MNIVIVDSNNEDLALLAHTIASALPKSQIEQFADPLLSAKYICNNPADIVFISDTIRPVNGFRLLQVLRKNVPTLTVVMLSSGDENRADAIRAGFDDYLVRPLSAEDFGSAVKRLIAV